ncbi:hypothetical protein E2C01_087616 [Portunus trituberculatus]|uniref:Uncharacterized protein n=1 Tax=Portunus trituberculatus TaxID=210409 RepID=A0A5B7JDV0_PORTR|nr:hypothetical protein [Portunus trituberculatus]
MKRPPAAQDYPRAEYGASIDILKRPPPAKDGPTCWSWRRGGGSLALPQTPGISRSLEAAAATHARRSLLIVFTLPAVPQT